MEHPFINDISDKNLEELQNTVADLNTKLSFAYRTGNQPLIHQLQMVIESYRNQMNKKMDEIFAKQKIKTQINIQSEK